MVFENWLGIDRHLPGIVPNLVLSEKLQVRHYIINDFNYEEWKADRISNKDNRNSERDSVGHKIAVYFMESIHKILIRKRMTTYMYKSGKIIISHKYFTEIIVDKLSYKHYLIYNVKKVNRWTSGVRRLSINTIDKITFLQIPHLYKTVIIPYIEKDCIFLKNVPSWICTVSEATKKKLNSLEDIYKKKFRFVPKKVFMECIKLNHFKKLWIIIQGKYSDNKSIDKIHTILYEYDSTSRIKLDTMDFAFKLKAPFNVHWSDKRINQVHDEYARLLLNKIPILAVNEKLKISKEFKEFDAWFSNTDLYKNNNFKLIKLNTKLREIGAVEGHCVGNYAHEVNSGRCVIYSCVYEDKPVTISIHKWICTQAMFRFNKVCSIKDLINAEIKTSELFIHKESTYSLIF